MLVSSVNFRLFAQSCSDPAIHVYILVAHFLVRQSFRIKTEYWGFSMQLVRAYEMVQLRAIIFLLVSSVSRASATYLRVCLHVRARSMRVVKRVHCEHCFDQRGVRAVRMCFVFSFVSFVLSVTNER